MGHWTNLVLTDGETVIEDKDQIFRALAEFRQTGTIFELFFLPGEHPWEDPNDASTWGPESPDSVDWTGFGEDTDA